MNFVEELIYAAKIFFPAVVVGFALCAYMRDKRTWRVYLSVVIGVPIFWVLLLSYMYIAFPGCGIHTGMNCK